MKVILIIKIKLLTNFLTSVNRTQCFGRYLNLHFCRVKPKIPECKQSCFVKVFYLNRSLDFFLLVDQVNLMLAGYEQLCIDHQWLCIFFEPEKVAHHTIHRRGRPFFVMNNLLANIVYNHHLGTYFFGVFHNHQTARGENNSFLGNDMRAQQHHFSCTAPACLNVAQYYRFRSHTFENAINV